MNRFISLAGGLLIAASTATLALASPAADAWVAKTKASLDAQVASQGLADDGRSVRIRVKVAPDGAGGLTIVESSGSADYDAAVKAAARKADVSRPPAELVGRTVTFTLGQPTTASGAP